MLAAKGRNAGLVCLIGRPDARGREGGKDGLFRRFVIDSSVFIDPLPLRGYF